MYLNITAAMADTTTKPIAQNMSIPEIAEEAESGKEIANFFFSLACFTFSKRFEKRILVFLLTFNSNPKSF